MSQFILPALKMLFTLENFLWINLGVFIGSVFAAIPGLTVILGIILFLPFTFASEDIFWDGTTFPLLSFTI